MRKCQVQIFAALSIQEAFILKKCNAIFCQTLFRLLPRFFPQMFANVFQGFGRLFRVAWAFSFDALGEIHPRHGEEA